MSIKIQVETYLRLAGAFTLVQEYSGKLKDQFYVEGAIVLQIGDTKILDLDLWDLVDQLWGDMVEGIKTISDGRTFERYFPDQPVKLTMRIDSRRTTVEIVVRADTMRSATVNYKAFLAALLPEAETFFCKMLELNPSHAVVYKAHLDNILALRARQCI